MIGEFLREAAVLVLVFGLLDRWLRNDRGPMTWGYGLSVLGASMFLLASGILVERVRGG